MAARRATSAALCRAAVVAMLVRLATPSGDPDSDLDLDPESTFIFDIGAGRRRLPVAMTAASGAVRRLPTDAMFHKLGHHFDPDRMSVDRPAASASGFNRSRDEDPELVRDLRRLRFRIASIRRCIRSGFCSPDL